MQFPYKPENTTGSRIFALWKTIHFMIQEPYVGDYDIVGEK